MSSSTRRCLWALAFSCSSAVFAAPAPPERTPEALKLVELEGRLAKDPLVYLVLDPQERRLDVRLRGIVLERLEVTRLELLTFHPLFGGGSAAPLLVPAIWTVTEGPGDTDRETIAPIALKPYPKEGEEEAAEKETPAAPGATPTPAPKKPGDSEKPSTYRVRLDIDWQILVINELPPREWWRRYADAVADGWLKVRGLEPSHPALIALVMPADNARRLHHLFRAKMPILVGNGASEIR